IAQQNSLPILWFSSCSSNCSCGGGGWEGKAGIMWIQQFFDGAFRRGGVCGGPSFIFGKQPRKGSSAAGKTTKQQKNDQKEMWRARASTGLVLASIGRRNRPLGWMHSPRRKNPLEQPKQ